MDWGWAGGTGRRGRGETVFFKYIPTSRGKFCIVPRHICVLKQQIQQKNMMNGCFRKKKDGLHGHIGTSTIRRFGLVGVVVALLEKVHHYGEGFEVSNDQVGVSMTFTYAACEPRCRTLSPLPSIMLPACCLRAATLPTVVVVD